MRMKSWSGLVWLIHLPIYINTFFLEMLVSVFDNDKYVHKDKYIVVAGGLCKESVISFQKLCGLIG